MSLEKTKLQQEAELVPELKSKREASEARQSFEKRVAVLKERMGEIKSERKALEKALKEIPDSVGDVDTEIFRQRLLDFEERWADAEDKLLQLQEQIVESKVESKKDFVFERGDIFYYTDNKGKEHTYIVVDTDKSGYFVKDTDSEELVPDFITNDNLTKERVELLSEMDQKTERLKMSVSENAKKGKDSRESEEKIKREEGIRLEERRKSLEHIKVISGKTDDGASEREKEDLEITRLEQEIVEARKRVLSLSQELDSLQTQMLEEDNVEGFEQMKKLSKDLDALERTFEEEKEDLENGIALKNKKTSSKIKSSGQDLREIRNRQKQNKENLLELDRLEQEMAGIKADLVTRNSQVDDLSVQIAEVDEENRIDMNDLADNLSVEAEIKLDKKDKVEKGPESWAQAKVNEVVYNILSVLNRDVETSYFPPNVREKAKKDLAIYKKILENNPDVVEIDSQYGDTDEPMLVGKFLDDMLGFLRYSEMYDAFQLAEKENVPFSGLQSAYNAGFLDVQEDNLGKFFVAKKGYKFVSEDPNNFAVQKIGMAEKMKFWNKKEMFGKRAPQMVLPEVSEMEYSPEAQQTQLDNLNQMYALPEGVVLDNLLASGFAFDVYAPFYNDGKLDPKAVAGLTNLCENYDRLGKVVCLIPENNLIACKGFCLESPDTLRRRGYTPIYTNVGFDRSKLMRKHLVNNEEFEITPDGMFWSKASEKYNKLEDDLRALENLGEATVESKPRDIVDINPRELMDLVGSENYTKLLHLFINRDPALSPKDYLKNIFLQKGVNETRLKELLYRNGYTDVKDFLEYWKEAGGYGETYYAIEQFMAEESATVLQDMKKKYFGAGTKIWEKTKNAFITMGPAAATVGLLTVAGTLAKAPAVVVRGIAGAIGGWFTAGRSTKIGLEKTATRQSEMQEKIQAKEDTILEKLKDTPEFYNRLLQRFGIGVDNRGNVAGGMPDVLNKLAVFMSDGLLASSYRLNRADGESQLSQDVEGIESDLADDNAVRANAVLALRSGRRRITQEAKTRAVRGEISKEELQDEQLAYLVTELNTGDTTNVMADLIKNNPKIMHALQKALAIKRGDFEALFGVDVKDKLNQDILLTKNKELLKKIMGALAGATIGVASSFSDELRGVSLGLAGAYLGGHFGNVSDIRKKEKEIHEEIKGRIDIVEEKIFALENSKTLLTAEDKISLQESSKDIRVAMSLGLLKTPYTLQVRARNILHRIESKLFFDESLRNVSMENLLTELEAEVATMKQSKVETLDKIKNKGGFFKRHTRSLVGMVAGGAVGFTAGYFGKDMSHWMAEKLGIAVPVAQPGNNVEVVASAVTLSSDHNLAGNNEIIDPAGTLPPDHALAGGGIESKLVAGTSIREIVAPQIFGLEVGKGGSAWGTLDNTLTSDATPQEFKDLFSGDKQAFAEWRTQQLEDMGFKKVGGKWGSPFTIFEGAKMNVYMGEDGAWHARFDDSVMGKTAGGREYNTIRANDTLHFQNTENIVPEANTENVVENNTSAEPVDPKVFKNNERFYQAMQSGLSDKGNLHHIVADTQVGPVLRNTGGMDSIRGIEFNEKTGAVNLFLHDRQGNSLDLPVQPEKTATGWKLNEVDRGLKPNPYMGAEQVNSSVQQGGWTASNEPAQPKFFNNTEVANSLEAVRGTIDPSHEFNAGGPVEVVAGKATIPVQDIDTGITKPVVVDGVKAVVPTPDGKAISITTPEGEKFDISYGRLAIMDAIVAAGALAAGALFLSRDRQITRKLPEKFVAPIVKKSKTKEVEPVVAVEEVMEEKIEEPAVEEVASPKEKVVSFDIDSYGRVAYTKIEGEDVFAFDEFNIEPKYARQLVYGEKEIPKQVLDSDISDTKFNNYTKELAGLRFVHKLLSDNNVTDGPVYQAVLKKTKDVVEKLKTDLGFDPLVVISEKFRKDMDLVEAEALGEGESVDGAEKPVVESPAEKNKTAEAVVEKPKPVVKNKNNKKDKKGDKSKDKKKDKKKAKAKTKKKKK